MLAVAIIMVLLAVMAMLSFSQRFPDRVLDAGMSLSQGLLAAMLLTVTFTQANISAMQAELQEIGLRRSGAIVEALQVPCTTIGGLPIHMVTGIEVWNAGQQATQIREAYFETSGSRQPVRVFWNEGGPFKNAEMDLETRVLEPGKMWQLRISPQQPIMAGKNPRFVVVPVLGDPAMVELSNPTMLDGPVRF